MEAANPGRRNIDNASKGKEITRIHSIFSPFHLMIKNFNLPVTLQGKKKNLPLSSFFSAFCLAFLRLMTRNSNLLRDWKPFKAESDHIANLNGSASFPLDIIKRATLSGDYIAFFYLSSIRVHLSFLYFHL